MLQSLPTNCTITRLIVSLSGRQTGLCTSHSTRDAGTGDCAHSQADTGDWGARDGSSDH